MIVSVELCVRSWFGHPEAREIGLDYTATPDEDKPGWSSPLVCWNLLDEDGRKAARVFEPTETTPRWVFTHSEGTREIEPPISHERLMTLMVEYRLRGGLDVDALHLQA